LHDDSGPDVHAAENIDRRFKNRSVWQTKTRTSIHHLRYFHDLTGQRIKKAMNTMKFTETHIDMMMDISGGVDAIKAHAPPIIIDTREGESVS
jgi:hypothetical protein